MLQNESMLSVADNSGAQKLLVIRCLGGSRRHYSRIGDLVIATVKKANPHAANIKKGQVVTALVVTSKQNFRRSNNS
jgi:large subunit ribosomal protein L14